MQPVSIDTIPALLVVVRHGETGSNAIRRNFKKLPPQAQKVTHYGINGPDEKVELSSLGHQQTKLTGIGLFQEFGYFDHARVSPLTRTQQSYENISLCAGERKPVMTLDENLREKSFGELDGLTEFGIQTLFPDEARRQKEIGHYHYSPPGGDNYGTVKNRVEHPIRAIHREPFAGSRQLFITHAIPCYSSLEILERMTPEEILSLDHVHEINNCGMLVFKPRKDGHGWRLRLVEYNKTYLPPHHAHDVS